VNEGTRRFVIAIDRSLRCRRQIQAKQSGDDKFTRESRHRPLRVKSGPTVPICDGRFSPAGRKSDREPTLRAKPGNRESSVLPAIPPCAGLRYWQRNRLDNDAKRRGWLGLRVAPERHLID
jgi:hypothetical protein